MILPQALGLTPQVIVSLVFLLIQWTQLKDCLDSTESLLSIADLYRELKDIYTIFIV